MALGNANNIRVLAIVSTLKNYPEKCITSILKQTISCSVVIVSASPIDHNIMPKGVSAVLHKADMHQSTGVRVAQSLNVVLRKLEISDYDYILKSDSDVIYPQNFLEKNLAAKFDLMGRGCAMLINVDTFLEVMNGHFAEVNADDVYLMDIFVAYGYKVLSWNWVLSPHIAREPRASRKRALGLGIDCFKLGKLPTSVLLGAFYLSLKRNSGYLFMIFGFMLAAVKREKKFQFAQKIKYVETVNLQKSIKRILKI